MKTKEKALQAKGGDGGQKGNDSGKNTNKVSTLCIGKGFVKGCERDISLCTKCTPAKELAVEQKGCFELVEIAGQMTDHIVALTLFGDELTEIGRENLNPAQLKKKLSNVANCLLSLACDVHFSRRDLYYNLLYMAMANDPESY